MVNRFVDSKFVEVDTDKRHSAGELGELTAELPDQPKSKYYDRGAKLDLCDTDAVKRDCGHDHERSLQAISQID